MRTYPALLAAATLIMATPAMAGNLTFSNGNAQWKSTRCMEPTTPPSLFAVSSETPASDMNTHMQTFNDYATAMQTYMDCISDEAQNDADLAGQAIIKSAEATIGATQTKVGKMREALQSKQ